MSQARQEGSQVKRYLPLQTEFEACLPEILSFNKKGTSEVKARGSLEFRAAWSTSFIPVMAI